MLSRPVLSCVSCLVLSCLDLPCLVKPLSRLVTYFYLVWAVGLLGQVNVKMEKDYKLQEKEIATLKRKVRCLLMDDEEEYLNDGSFDDGNLVPSKMDKEGWLCTTLRTADGPKGHIIPPCLRTKFGPDYSVPPVVSISYRAAVLRVPLASRSL